MKKRVLSLLAACAVVTTSFVGLVQTAYAEGHNVNIVVSDGASETQKVLKFYYEGLLGEYGLAAFNGDLSLSSGTINSFNYSGVNPAYKGNSTTNGVANLWFSDDDGAFSTDGEFATAVVTVPTDVDTTVTLAINEFYDAEDWEDYSSEVGTVQVTIPKKASEPEGPIVTVDEQAALNGTKEFAAQSAKIYAVQIAANNFTVTGADVSVGGQKKSISFSTEISGSGTAAFAVILANDKTPTNDLPEFSADNVTPITKPVD